MQFTSAAGSGNYRRLGPVIFDDEMIGVMDGKYVVGSVGRKSVAGIRLETRKSFKHPIAGLVVGLIMVLAPLVSVIGSPLGVGLRLTSPSRGIGAFCMFFFGVYLLWGVATRKDEPWLVFVLRNGERGFPMNAELSPEEMKLAESLCPGVTGAVNLPIERALGFEVLPAKPHAQKEEA